VDPKKIGSMSSPTLRPKNLRSARSVSTVRGSLSVLSTQSEEFIALKQQYQELSMNYDELHQIVIKMRSKMGDDTCAAPF
jgi:acyl carrier protein phosphodiesterase